MLAELDFRKVVVFVHTTSAGPIAIQKDQSHLECYASSVPLVTAYSAPLFGFFFDSGRSVLDLIKTGRVCRDRNICWVIPHCGGFLPSLIDHVVAVLRPG